MAQAPLTSVSTFTNVSAVKATLANGDHMAAWEAANFSDKSVHVYGTFGVGGSVSIYGSNNPADIGVSPASGTWVLLTDPQANALTKTSQSIEQILENTLYVSALVTAGDGTTAITVAFAGKQVN